MKYIPTEIEGVWIVEPRKFADARGYFMESFKLDEFREAIERPDILFVQDNESVSSRGVLRGLHLQRGNSSQAKLVRVSQGRVLDVAVDLRKESATFGKYVAVELSADNSRQLFIPRRFAHGFVVLSDTAQFQYKVDNVYDPSSEATLMFNDPVVGVQWGVDPAEMVLSPKDLNGLSFSEICDII